MHHSRLWSKRVARSFRRHLDVAAQPCKTLKDTLAGGRAAGLDLPDVVFGDDVEVQGVGNVFGTHGCNG